MESWRKRLVAMALVAGLAGAAAALPDGWSGRDVGPCVLIGGSREADGKWTLKGSGQDIGGAADSFRFAFQSIKGDGSITARVVSLDATNAGAKVGVMVRASVDREDAFALAAVTPAGVRLISRDKAAAATKQIGDQAAGKAPYWVRLERAGGTVTASCSADGQTWAKVGQVEVGLPVVALMGLCITSADNGQLATASVDNVTVTRAGGSVPAPWKTADLGAVNPEGESAMAAGKWTLTAAGADMWDPADNGHFVYQKLSGDVTAVACVQRLGAVDPWSKCGVMVRESLEASSAMFMTVVTGGSGVHVQLRPGNGAACVDNGANAGAGAPYWVKLQRKGDTLTGSCSKDGKEWAQVFQYEVKMAKDVLVGLCLTSHKEDEATTAELTDVAVTQG